MANMTPDEIKFLVEETKKLNQALAESRNISLSINDIDTARAKQSDINTNNEKLANELRENSKKLTEEQKKLLVDIEGKQRGINTELTKEEKTRRRTNNLMREANNQMKIGWDYLIKSDKVIRQTILNLGLSGAKAELMRKSFEDSALHVAHLGGSLEDVQKIMEGYAEETGRARVLTASMVEDITSIGKGTGLGIEQATKLGAQFEIMGFDAKATMEYVQGVVDTTERMGVNTTKVLKNVSDNFKKLNTYTFQQGVRGMAQMASYAEKFKIDIGQALNAADVAKSLEGAIDLAANLQVMGGEFAKTDPFEMLFLSRNDPAKFTEKIADMTKGVVSFRKMADGSFEKFISPADRDRLASVGKSLGMEVGQLTEMALRQAEIQKMRQQMQGMGLTDQQKELIEGAAFFDKKSGKFQVELAGTMRDISTLTKDQANAFQKEKKSLADRAVASQDFETALKATLDEFKSILLPMLKGINTVLTTIRPIVSSIATFINGLMKTDIGATILKGAGMLMAAGFLIDKAFSKVTGKGLTDNVRGWFGKKGGGGFGGGGGNPLAPTAGSPSGLFEQRKGIGQGAMMKGQGMKSLGQGVGAGAAMAGAGAGINLAAAGISKLADSMSKLTPEQAKSLQSIAMTLAISFPLAAVGIAAVGLASTAAAVPILAVGAAMVGVGFGVKLATDGIAKMALGLSEMNKSGGGAGKQLLGVAGGVGAITMAMGMGGVASMFAFNNSLARMAKNSGGIEKIGTAFSSIQTVLSGSKDDFLAVENAIKSISGLNVKGGGAIAELTTLLKSPLKVEFAGGKVAMVNDITLNLDGQTFMRKAYDVNIAVQKHESARHGKGS